MARAIPPVFFEHFLLGEHCGLSPFHPDYAFVQCLLRQAPYRGTPATIAAI